MNVKRPWLHEVDAATALFVRRHAMHTDEFEQKTEHLSSSSDGTLWKVDRYAFDRVYDQALDDVYRSIRRQVADIFSFHPGDIQIGEGFTDVTTLRYLVLHPFTRDVYVDVAPSGVVETVYVWMHPIEVCQQRDQITRVTLDVSNIATETELHEQLKEQLQFPSHYGMNWDAFWDVITDENGLPDIVELYGWTEFEQRLPVAANTLAKCFLDYANEPDLKLCQIHYHQTEMLILPRQALKEGEANRLIYRHLAGATFPLRVKRKTSVRLPKRHRFSLERIEEESVLSGIVRSHEEIAPWLTLSIEDQRQDVVTFSHGTDWLLSYYREGLTLQGENIESVESIDTADYETFFHHVTRGPYPIELTFCFGGTIAPSETVYRLTLHDAAWEKLIEETLLPQLKIPKAKRFWQSFSSTTSQQSLETFLGECHPHIFGNFLLAHDADDVYHFIDHVNGSIKRF
ncbi:barstar family protein [Exiguobacterium aurantiacum]|uniref:Ribonuclease inhibitor n=1 Tax=Exiguobacterium aurantiacum TaxID=33987 RepID=A0A377FTM1_9BACL|nr:barstar family protein [Exiguobacterium aurantiacum]STO08160.1 Ribonuclease inhibitor [Exiguobacterium aurantiacum]